MKPFKIILLTILICFSIGCSSNKVILKKNKLDVALKSEIFADFFEICKERQDTIIVYNNLNKFKKIEPINSNCSKILLIKESKIKIDVNSMSLDREDKIVFYKFEVKKDISKFYFIHIGSNAHIDISINRNDSIIDYKTGIY